MVQAISQSNIVLSGANLIGLNAWLLSDGLAAAFQYSTDYAMQEAAARQANREIWTGRFTRSPKWRRTEGRQAALPKSAESPANGGMARRQIMRARSCSAPVAGNPEGHAQASEHEWESWRARAASATSLPEARAGGVSTPPLYGRQSM